MNLDPKLAGAFKRHNVETFRIDENQETKCVTYYTRPVASQALQEDLRMLTPAIWDVTFLLLPENWNKPMPIAEVHEQEEFEFAKIKKLPMTKEEYMAFHEACCQKMVAITKAKNSDYTGGSGDPFANFQQIGMLVQVPSVVEIGFLTRMSDKISRIGSFVTKGSLLVKDESVEDTLLDLANYCILFAGYLKSKRGQQ